jgi:hypothetical protein
MEAAANYLTVSFQYGAHGWIRAGETFALGCETDGLLHE